MPKILIVEDDTDKLRRIVGALCEVDGITMEMVSEVRDSDSAKRRLEQEVFDLLILDIAIPDRIDREARLDGGIRLLEEIETRDRYRRPSHIVGITALEDARATASERFARRLWTVLPYAASSDDWIAPLQARARHIVAASQVEVRPQRQYESDLSIVCALPVPELSQVLRLDWSWEQIHVPLDDAIYYRGTVRHSAGTFVVHAAATNRMGMPSAACLAMKMIQAFRPRYLAMAGITAGVRGRTKLGDVVVADPTWDYGSGKLTVQDGEATFLPAPHQLQLSSRLRNKLRIMAGNDALLASVRQSWPASKPDHALSIHVGPLASGASVVADATVLEKVMAQHRKLLAIEMETYAIFAAAEEAAEPKPIPFSMKSVCDYADTGKGDEFQDYAAYTSAQILRLFVEQELITLSLD